MGQYTIEDMFDANYNLVNLDRINQQAIQGWYQLANKLSGILYI